MFDSEARIRDWKTALSSRDGMKADIADELEDHLRSAMEQLRAGPGHERTRLSEEEIFLVATRRVGHPDRLAVEFERVVPGEAWRRRWIWLLCGYLGGHFLFQVIITVAAIAFGTTRNIHPMLATTLYAAIILIGLLAIVLGARSEAMSRTLGRVRDALVPRLRSTTGILVCFAILMAASAAVTPIGFYVVQTTAGEGGRVFGVMQSASSMTETALLQGSRIGLWLAPFVALAVLVRSRQASRNAGSAGSGASA